MRIAYITSGAAGMYCGSCMKDNTLAAALNAQGRETLLIPTYTPIRVDEDDVSQQRVFFGGINVFLEQKSWLFRHTPWFLDKLLNGPRLLRWASRFAVKTQADRLGDLAVSMLQGRHGKQRKEIAKLLRFLKDDVKPDVVILTNLLISGMAADIRESLNIPIWGTLQGDDIFLEALPPEFRDQCRALIRSNAASMAGHFATSAYYADFMANYLGIPRHVIHVVHPGIKPRGHGGPREFRSSPPFAIGYFARICPEKGLHQLVDAFIRLCRMPAAPDCRLRISGWLGGHQRAFFHEQMERLTDAGLRDRVEHVESPDHAGKVNFLRSVDVLSVPTVYREPKGIYILEALANGTPVVQPRHGSFPELIAATGGGLLVEPGDADALAAGLKRMLTDHDLRRELGQKGQAAVHERFTDHRMAADTWRILNEHSDVRSRESRS